VESRKLAEETLADSQRKLVDANRARWGRRDHDAIASAEGRLNVAAERLARVAEAEHDLRVRLGPAPTSPAGRSVWCHYALVIEAARDRGGATTAGRASRADLAATRIRQVNQQRQAVAG
jgi:hypothetical protein